jgi:hypothetical protein
MTLRGTVRDGVIAINTHGTLPEGAEVEVVRVEPAKNGHARATSRKKIAKKKPSRKGAHPLVKLAGIWRDRPEWKGLSSLEIQQQLRRKAGIGRARG